MHLRLALRCHLRMNAITSEFPATHWSGQLTDAVINLQH
jgi:hypothetical protein